MKIRRATSADNQKLCEYFNRTPLPGDVDLQPERRDFFAPYRLQSDDFSTYILTNDKDEIEALASLIFREGWLGGQKQKIGIACDLRVSPSRGAILNWAQHFLPLLEEEKQSRNCHYVFTVVAQMQRQAYNAFIRPRLTRRTLPRYHLFRSFRLISVHGRLPFAPEPLSAISLRAAESGDLDQLASYIAQRQNLSVLRFTENPQSVVDQLRRWPNLSLRDFLIARDSQGQIVGCVAPWKSDSVQQMTILNYHRRARVLYDSLKGLAFTRMSKRLSDPGQPLRFQYLSHFHADNPDIFYSLLVAAHNQAGRDEFVVYPHFQGDLIMTPPRTFITAAIKSGLYCIQDPQEISPDFMIWSRQSRPPELDWPHL